jgi:hypothetical protein
MAIITRKSRSGLFFVNYFGNRAQTGPVIRKTDGKKPRKPIGDPVSWQWRKQLRTYLERVEGSRRPAGKAAAGAGGTGKGGKDGNSVV